MNVNRSNGPNSSGASERYREAMDAFVQRTRVRLAQARHVASRLAEVRLDHAKNAEERAAAELERPNVEQTRERKDRVDISEGMQAQAREAQDPANENEDVIRPKVARLKHAYRTGKLDNTPEVFERAARNMLRRSAGEANLADVPNLPDVPNLLGESNLPNEVPNTGGGSNL